MVVGSATILNLVPSGVMPVVYLNQTDAGYDTQFLIYNGSQPYNVPEGVSVTIRGRKGDDYGITENAEFTVGSNLITVHITEQITAVAGDRNIFELVFVDAEGLRVGTINIIFAVERDALGDAVISESEISYAEHVITELQSIHAEHIQIQQNKANIAKEIQDRTAAVDAETTRAKASETTLQNNINAETNRAKAAESTLQSNINAEASTRASATSNLQSQINQIVAPSGSAPSAAEVENARIGANGITYSSLGGAIRGQFTEVNSNALLNKGNIADTTLDLNGGDFIHPGMWALVDPSLKPANYPSQKGGRIISFASNSDSTFSTIQVVVDYNSILYYRYSYARNEWGPWYTLDLLNTMISKGNITTAGLDLNTGDFIHPGMWSLIDLPYKPSNWPSDVAGRLVSFTSGSDSSVATLQVVCDYFNALYYRYSTSNGTWRQWIKVADDSLVAKAAVSLLWKSVINDTSLDINTGDFVKPGIWKVTDATKAPKNWVSAFSGQLVTFSSDTASSALTMQYLMDWYNNVFMRYSRSNGDWNDWLNLRSGLFTHRKTAFKPIFTDFERFQNSYSIPVHTAGASGNVAALYALYDGETAEGITITKTSFGKDSSGEYDIYRYKVSKNIGEKPIVLVICGEHSNEMNSAMLGYYAYKEVVNGALTQYLDYVDFVFVPMLSPWGYDHNSRNNYNGVNINRDFPAMWSYSTDAHNKTGDTSMSQVETQYIMDYVLDNKEKIIFAVNKHDTGTISRKINGTEEDIICYLSSNMVTDRTINNGVCSQQNTQVRTTDPWIVDDCIDMDISAENLIPSVSYQLPGSMDLFFNSVGIHASLLEVSYRAYDSSDTTPRYNAPHDADLRRLGLDFFINYLASTIEHCDLLLSSDETIQQTQKYYSRKKVGDSWQNIELAFNRNTNTFVEQ